MSKQPAPVDNTSQQTIVVDSSPPNHQSLGQMTQTQTQTQTQEEQEGSESSSVSSPCVRDSSPNLKVAIDSDDYCEVLQTVASPTTFVRNNKLKIRLIVWFPRRTLRRKRRSVIFVMMHLVTTADSELSACVSVRVIVLIGEEDCQERVCIAFFSKIIHV